MAIVIYIILIGFISLIIYKNNKIVLLLTIELILIAIAIFYIYISLDIDNSFGLYFSIILLTLGAIESAIGLSLIIIT